MRRVAVVGGGLSGLATSFYLLEEAARQGLQLDLSLWESADRCGGKISTVAAEGFHCETGPNGFLDSVPQTLELVESLGLGDRLLKSSDAARRRFVFSDGRLRQLPESPLSFFRSDILSLGGRLRIVGEYFVPRRTGEAGEDETVASFISRRLGREALEKLIDPMTSGIYAGDPERMSMASCFPKIQALEENYGGLIRGMIAKQKEAKARGASGPGAGPGGTLTSFDRGLQELIDSLENRLEGRVRTSARAVGLSWPQGEKGRTCELAFEDGSRTTADAVVLAVPAYAAARILNLAAPRAADLLQEIPYTAVSVVHLGYDLSQSTSDLNGFGFLIPHREKRRILGSLWSSSIFRNRAPEGKALVTNMVGGARDSATALLDEEELIKMVGSELGQTMNQRAAPEFSLITKWEKAIPQYIPGHGRRLEDIEGEISGLPDVFLTGNAYRGIGVNDCVKAAIALAPQVIEQLLRKTP